MIELGVGFHPELTGEENIRLYASVMGLGPVEITERYPAIVEFSASARSSTSRSSTTLRG